jgi:hypothetical protein
MTTQNENLENGESSERFHPSRTIVKAKNASALERSCLEWKKPSPILATEIKSQTKIIK